MTVKPLGDNTVRRRRGPNAIVLLIEDDRRECIEDNCVCILIYYIVWLLFIVAENTYLMICGRSEEDWKDGCANGEAHSAIRIAWPWLTDRPAIQTVLTNSIRYYYLEKAVMTTTLFSVCIWLCLILMTF